MILRYGHQAIGLTDDMNRDSTELQSLAENDSDEKTETSQLKKGNNADIDSAYENQMSSMSSVFMQFLNLDKHEHANVLSSQVATSMIVAISKWTIFNYQVCKTNICFFSHSSDHSRLYTGLLWEATDRTGHCHLVCDYICADPPH